MSNFKRFSNFMLIAALFTFTLTACSKKPPEDVVLIPAGEFTMGSDDVDKEAKAIQYGSRKPWYMNEHPRHKASAPEFYIDKTEVTNSAYKEFLGTTGHAAPPDWTDGAFEKGKETSPVIMVSWFDAKAYCEWKGKRLPTEIEWEKAARGTDGRQFPWGNEFDIKKLNTLGDHGGTLPVGTFRAGVSPYGLFDMSGNAQEWTSDSYKAYANSDYEDSDYGEKFKVVRGGGWGGIGHYASMVYVRTSYRNQAPPGGKYDDVGFRCVWE
ncbi:MAG: SUMF1/EgtB/PvdO family nonheme iron enzyme [Thermodesulfobacteriota bacterium]